MKLHDDVAWDYQPLLLLRNVSYPTYQLHAIAGKGTNAPQTVLKIAILETIKWLKLRFRAFELPQELDMPEPEEYEVFDLSDLSSFHLDMGYKLQVIWLPNRGIWTMQLTEPDLGDKPGAEDKKRMPVPGRLFETNVSYNMIASGVECGFKTVVHEPQGTKAGCEVYRLAFIKNLARNPKVGLWQTWPIIDEAHTLSDYADIKRMKNWLADPGRMMPAVVFSEYAMPAEPSPCVLRTDMQPALTADRIPYRGFDRPMRALIMGQDAKPSLPLDISSLTRYRMGYAQFFVLTAAQREAFIENVGRHIGNGEILIIEPSAFGGKTTLIPCDTIEANHEKAIKNLDVLVQNYPKGKAVSFGQCVFVPQAQALEREAIINLHQSKDEMVRSFLEQKDEIESRYRQKLAEQAEKSNESERRIGRLKDKVNELEEEKRALKFGLSEIESRYKKKLAEKEGQIRYFKGLKCRPRGLSGVAAWVEERFEGRLILPEKAKDLLGKTRPEEVDLPLLCDALEYLAMEYRDELIGLIDKETRDRICSEKYGRPFEVVPTTSLSVQMYSAEYKIKYYTGFKGKPIESLLDLHLRVGRNSANLLRIYFLYDKKRKLIVVGSLPKHLSIQSYK